MSAPPLIGTDEYIQVAWQRWNEQEQQIVPLPRPAPQVDGINIEQAIAPQAVQQALQTFLAEGLLDHPIFGDLCQLIQTDASCFVSWLPEIAYTAQLPHEVLDRLFAASSQASALVKEAFADAQLPPLILLVSELDPRHQRSLAWMTPDEKPPVLVLEKIAPMPLAELVPVLVHELIHTLQPLRAIDRMQDFSRVQREGMSAGRKVLHQIDLLARMTEEIATEVMAMRIAPMPPRRSGYLPMINSFVQAIAAHDGSGDLAAAWNKLSRWAAAAALIDCEQRVQMFFAGFGLDIRDAAVTRAWVETGIDLGDYFHALMGGSITGVDERIAHARQFGEELVHLIECLRFELALPYRPFAAPPILTRNVATPSAARQISPATGLQH